MAIHASSFAVMQVYSYCCHVAYCPRHGEAKRGICAHVDNTNYHRHVSFFQAFQDDAAVCHLR